MAVVVEVDGGRLRTRATREGGVHQAENKGTRSLAWRRCSVRRTARSRPQPPARFLQPRRVQRLVQQMAGQAGEPSTIARGRGAGGPAGQRRGQRAAVRP